MAIKVYETCNRKIIGNSKSASKSAFIAGELVVLSA